MSYFSSTLSSISRKKTLRQNSPVTVIARIRETVHYNGRRLAMEHFAYSTIQFVIGDRRPIGLLLIRHWLYVARHRRFRTRIAIRVIVVGRTIGGRRRFCQISVRRLGVIRRTTWARNARQRRTGVQMVRIEPVGGVTDVVRHVRFDQLLEGQQGMTGNEIVVSWNENGR